MTRAEANALVGPSQWGYYGLEMNPLVVYSIGKGMRDVRGLEQRRLHARLQPKTKKKGLATRAPGRQQNKSTNAIYSNEPVSQQHTISPRGKWGKNP